MLTHATKMVKRGSPLPNSFYAASIIYTKLNKVSTGKDNNRPWQRYKALDNTLINWISTT